MTKISKETKLRALTEYFAGQGSSLGIALKTSCLNYINQ